MDSRTIVRAAMNIGKLTKLLAWGINTMAITVIRVPVKINGFLFPIFVSVLSEILPKSGSKKSAKTLSAAIIIPVLVSLKLKVLDNIRGIRLS